MPEVGIGFFPDVGASFPLARAPGFAGTYLALTGNRVGAADAIFAGLPIFTLPRRGLPKFPRPSPIAVRRKMYGVRLDELSSPPAPGRLPAAHGWIDGCYAATTVEDIVERLCGQAGDEPRAALEAMRKASPTSLKVTLRNLRLAASFNRVEESFQQDYRIALACIAGHDFIEGIRAAIVDKDRNPAWRPDTIAAVTPDIVEAHFRSVGELELKFKE